MNEIVLYGVQILLLITEHKCVSVVHNHSLEKWSSVHSLGGVHDSESEIPCTACIFVQDNNDNFQFHYLSTFFLTQAIRCNIPKIGNRNNLVSYSIFSHGNLNSLYSN